MEWTKPQRKIIGSLCFPTSGCLAHKILQSKRKNYLIQGDDKTFLHFHRMLIDSSWTLKITFSNATKQYFVTCLTRISRKNGIAKELKFLHICPIPLPFISKGLIHHNMRETEEIPKWLKKKYRGKCLSIWVGK